MTAPTPGATDSSTDNASTDTAAQAADAAKGAAAPSPADLAAAAAAAAKGAAAAKAAEDGKPIFTQAALDAILQKRVAEEKAAAAKALKNAQESAGKQGVELAETQRDQAKAEAEEAKTAAARGVAEARIDAAIAASGVKPERVDAVAGLLTGQVDAISKADDPKKAAADAVEVAKGSYPEFWATTGNGAASASGADLAAGGQPGVLTVEQFTNLTYDERAKLFATDKAAYQRLRDAEAQKAGV